MSTFGKVDLFQIYYKMTVKTNQNFNGSSGDFGGDTKSLEERGLLRTQPSVLGGHRHITRGDGSSTGGCWYLRFNRANFKTTMLFKAKS